MNKRTKISLILVITVFLVILSVSLASARSSNSVSCNLEWQVWTTDGEPGFWLIPGEVKWIQDGSILTEICSGNIPFGETVGKTGFIIFDLDEMRDYLFETYGAVVKGPFVIGPDETGDTQLTYTYQGIVTSYDWSLFVKPNGDFEYVAYFEIE